MQSSTLGLNRFDIKKQLGQGSFSKHITAPGVFPASDAQLGQGKDL